MHPPICTVLTTIVSTHLYQFWFSTWINILMVADICNFDRLVTIFYQGLACDCDCIFQWEFVLIRLSPKITFSCNILYLHHLYLHHIIFAPPLLDFSWPYCNKICIRLFPAPHCNTGFVFSSAPYSPDLHFPATNSLDLYFPAPNSPPPTCGDKLLLVDRVAHLSSSNFS